MKRRLLAAAALLIVAAPAPAVLPPAPADERQFLGVVPTADGIDVYWFRWNRLVTPVMLRYYRTAISHDGRRLETVLVHETATPPGWPPTAIATTS